MYASFLLSIYLEMLFVGHMITLNLTFRLFLNSCTIFTLYSCFFLLLCNILLLDYTTGLGM
jgi:hypothetical protein